MANRVQSSPWCTTIPTDILELTCGFLDIQSCPQAMLTCKVWQRIFTPYNGMLYDQKLFMFDLAHTYPPRDRPGMQYHGASLDIEHSNLRMRRAFEIVAGTEPEERTFTHLDLMLLPGHDIAKATELFRAKTFCSLTNLNLVYVLSRELLQGIREGCPLLRSLRITEYSAIGAEALCQELNACKSLEETRLARSRPDDLQKLQKLNSLTELTCASDGIAPRSIRDLAEGYPSLRMLRLSGGVAGQQPVLLARPWVQNFVELESLASRLLGLHLFRLTKAESVCVATQFLPKASKLQALRFSTCDFDSDCFKQFPRCPSLTALHLAIANKEATDVTMQSVAKCAKLRFLRVDFPSCLDLGKGLEYLAGHKTIQDLTLDHGNDLQLELLETAANQLVSVAGRMPALRVLDLPITLHPLVVRQLPHHNVYTQSRGPGEPYKLLPSPTPEKLESKRDGT